MRRVRSAVVTIGLLCGSVGLFSAPSAEASGPGSIIGTVTDSTGHPLSGVEYWTGYSFGSYPKTAADGSYSIDNLWPGWGYQVNFHDTSGLHADLTGPMTTVLDTDAAVLDVVMQDAVLSIHGRVTDDAGNPVAGVVVREQFNYWVSATTNSDGYYGLSGLSDGSHDLSFETYLGAPEFRGQNLSGVIVQSGTTTEADVTLQRYGKIELNVTAGGLPAIASATLWQDLTFDNPAGYAHTDDNGVMSFNIGADGDYFLQIYAEQPGYASEFFPDTINREQAQRIHIVGDQQVHLDASLEEQAIITGIVLQPDGTPGQWFDVSARPAGLADNAATDLPTCNLPTDNDPPGTFRVGCLHPSADWVLKAAGMGVANNEYYQDSQSPNHATVIQVDAGQTVSGIVIQLDPKSPNPTLLGLSKEYFQTGTTTAGVHVYGSNFPSDPFAMTLATDFWWSGINTTIQVTSVLNPHEAIATVTVDPGTVGPTPITKYLTLNTSLGGFADCSCQLYLGDSTTQVATATGRVTDQRGRPVPYSTVSVRTPNPNVSGGYDIRKAITGADGRWTADGLRPGSYQVVFQGTIDLSGQWWNGKTTDAAATTFTLAGGQTKTGIDARLSKRDAIKIVKSKQKYQSPQLSFDLVGEGLSPINGDFRVSIDYGWGLMPLQAASTSNETIHVTGAVYGTGPFDIVTEWTRADGTVASTRCTACFTVYAPLQVYGYGTTVAHGTTATLTFMGYGLVDLTSLKVSGSGVSVNSWSVDPYGQLLVVVTAKNAAALGTRTLTIKRVDGATTTAEFQVV